MKTSTIRKSQLIFNSGPGAIVETADWSGVVSSVNEWNLEKLSLVPRKSRRGYGLLVRPPIVTSKIGFSNPVTPNGVVPVKRFPIWVQCSRPSCSVFGPYYKVCSPTDPYKCVSCGAKLVPARLIRICAQGHIDDFPWEKFYHGDEICNIAHPKMTLKAADNQTGALSDLKIHCRCGLHENGVSLGDVYNFPLAKGCTGNKPWISANNDTCGETPLVVLRGASNVYFPDIESELTIPESQEKLQRFFEEDLERYRDLFVGDTPEGIKHTLSRPVIVQLAEQKGIDFNELVTFVIARFSNPTVQEKDEIEIRSAEHKVLIDPSIVREDIDPKVFVAANVEVPSPLARFHIGTIAKVSRLQEIRILKGFRRVYPSSNDGKVKLIDLGEEAAGRYPATEVNGEGIFLSLDEMKLREWESKNEVKIHCSKVIASAQSSFRELPFEITPRSILLHSLSHLLIKQMSLYGGYSSVSIREKIYSFPDRNGILLYTGESDSEGTMGGIVSMCESTKMHHLFEEALAEAKWCSSDPVCSENAHDLAVSYNLAACHACVYLSETSCELSNRYLDRNVLINDAIGFFV